MCSWNLKPKLVKCCAVHERADSHERQHTVPFLRGERNIASFNHKVAEELQICAVQSGMKTRLEK